MRIKKCLDRWHVSAAPQRVDLRHSIALMQGGEPGKLPAAVESEGGFPNIFVGSEEGELVECTGLACH
jgi:hypothetical protein